MGEYKAIGGLTPMEQFIAYVEIEKELNPPPPGKKHICEWALEQIYDALEKQATPKEPT